MPQRQGAGGVFIGEDTDMGLKEQLTACLERAVENHEAAGINLLVLRDGEEMCYAQAGSADIESGKPVARDSIFRLYSQTKPITAAAVMLLADRGLIDLMACVDWYLPGFRNPRVIRADGTTDNVRMSFDVTTLAGPWNVSFPEGWGMPGQMTIDALEPWKELGTTLEAKAFSGTADYTIDFTLDKVDEGSIVVLDLGRVESLAKVEVNGKDFGDVWSPPYRIPLTGAVKAGKNTLKVSVTDTWYNRLVFDAGQPQAKHRTWTLAGPKKGSSLRDSGLIGPVRIVSEH